MALDGYIFNLEREYATYSNWYCENRHATPEKCRARAVLQVDEISVKVGHNHDSDQPSVKKRIVLSKLYKQAESSVEAPSSLIAEVLEGVSDEVKKSLPSKEVMAASFNEFRAKTYGNFSLTEMLVYNLISYQMPRPKAPF
uniref:FLYWCH-type domain-containing protein n=1 Tax=Acrobeloides nanus TaxID=290746 RepID=A0A914E5G9_9BILA